MDEIGGVDGGGSRGKGQPEAVSKVGGFSWIGTNDKEFFDDIEAARAFFRAQWQDQDVPFIICEKGSYTTQLVTHEVCLVLCRYHLYTPPESGLVLSEWQRATMVMYQENDVLYLGHIHASNPWALVTEKEKFAVTAGRANYEYVHELVMAERLARLENLPGLTVRQKKVLYFLGEGYTYNEISAVMSISARTVRYYVNELIKRFRVDNRAQLLATILPKLSGAPHKK